MKRTRSIGTALLFMIFLLALLPGLIVQADFGTNWTATLFPNTSLSGPGVTVAGVSAINFNWGTNPPNINGTSITGCPAPTAPSTVDCSDNFSIRFTSSQTFSAGAYQFVVAADDTVRVIIDGGVALEKFNASTGRPLTTDTFNVNLTAGIHNITVEYNEFIGEAIIQVQWFLQGQGGTPGSFGTPVVVGTAIPALSVQVKNVKGLALRTGPYLGASLVSVVRPGTSYAPIARNKDEGTFTWFLITVDNHTGWASGRYLEVAGDPNTIPIQSTVFEQIDGAADTSVRATPRSIMNFRRRPSQRAATIGQISWGENLELLGRTIQGGENFWFQVRYNGQVGWIYAPFVSTYGDINLVPIR